MGPSVLRNASRVHRSSDWSADPQCDHWATIGSVARTQTIVQLTDDLLAALDARREREGRSRSELIREAIEAYLAADREAAIDRAILDGYTRVPPAENLGAAWSARTTIAAEPWENARD